MSFNMHPYDVIIVGLGCAGVTASTTLVRAGKKVLGLEAMDRIGGRVKTVTFGDGVVEEGAEWIHGTVKSRIFDAAVKHNVPILPQDMVFHALQSDGTQADHKLINDLIEFAFEKVGKPPKDFTGGLGEFITGRVMEYVKQNYPHLVNDKSFLTEFFELMNLYINNHESSNDWNDVSAQSRYTELDGHQHMSWHRHGYKTFFEIMLNTYKNGPGLPNLDIKLNTEVSQIVWPKDGAGDVKVSCADGSTYTANHVIVTVSLGVLKDRHKTLFNPGLPQEKIKAIENTSIGVMDKIIFKFEEPWWPKQCLFFAFLWKPEDKERVPKEDYWTTRIFAASNPMGSRNALTLWTSGDVAKMLETLPENLVKRKCMDLLRKFMGKICVIPEPTGMIRSTWYTNPFTRGSYSYDNRLTLQNPNARTHLAEPLRDKFGCARVLFAGEATDLTHFSAAHGACDSGYREAMRLLGNKYSIVVSGTCNDYLKSRRKGPISAPIVNSGNKTTDGVTRVNSSTKVTVKSIKKNLRARAETTLSTLYDIETAYDYHVCPLSCPNTYDPVCVAVNRGHGLYFKFYTFVNHCAGDLYYCKHWQEFSPPPDEGELVKSSPLSWSYCAANKYIQYARFSEVTSSMGYYGWLAGDHKYSHIMEPHERIKGYG
ncbi:unnamed protein product [Leptosia nina]|uniref:Amine oxidase domain-containing protein n=1 Tax=Leptosia nina TaxID=320188 RepID=A0AAV1K1M3_9NEOP